MAALSFYGIEDPYHTQAEALAMVHCGASAWNTWIKVHDPENYEARHVSLARARANLRQTDLQGHDLKDFDLRRIDLQAAVLRDANLISASLVDTHAEEADFSGAVCRNADFCMTYHAGARYDGVDFRYAKFELMGFPGCSLERVNLRLASFKNVDFMNATMHGAVLDETSFVNCDLSQVVGLSTWRHLGPSMFDFATLLQSRKVLPESFMREAGVPEIIIDYLPSLIGEPIQFYSCFISYSSVNISFANRLYADLQARGIRCWYAPDHMSIGSRIRDTIDQSIRIYDKLILILSKDSIQSDWVEAEVEAALEKERESNRIAERDSRIITLFPISIDDAVNSTSRAWARNLVRTRNIGDFTNWKDPDCYTKSLERLINDLRISH